MHRIWNWLCSRQGAKPPAGPQNFDLLSLSLLLIQNFCQIWLTKNVQFWTEFNIFIGFSFQPSEIRIPWFKLCRLLSSMQNFIDFQLFSWDFSTFFQNLVLCQKSFLTQNFFSSQRNELSFGHSQDITLRKVFPESYQKRIDGSRDFFIFIHPFL